MSNYDLRPKTPRAVLVGVQTPDVSDESFASSLAELSRLVHTLGFEVIGHLTQKRKVLGKGTMLGEGKLKELARFTGGSGVIQGFRRPGEGSDDEGDEDEVDFVDETDESYLNEEGYPKATVVIFDHEISPTQLKNLEEATGVEVLDRTGVILEIFSRHAKSREARLQVEIAKLAYLAPRLRASKVGGDRQGGGIGAKGAGESAHELDKRRIRDRIAELRGQLAAIHGEQNNRRSSRREAPVVALVGYTNAGKSSMMRALTGSEVLVADKLFATLDTTVRALVPETVPKILVSDTVGFIKKLPHDLVASFRSTLDEALNASLLLFTVDASDHNFRSQLEVTRTVLAEIGATDNDQLLLLNKSDRLSEEEIHALRMEFPEAVMVSAKRPEDVTRVHRLILDYFERDMIDRSYVVPYTKGHFIGIIHDKARVITETFEEDGTHLLLRAQASFHSWLENELARS